MPAMGRGRAAPLPIGALLVAALLAGCGGGGDKTFKTASAGFSFKYPSSFDDLGSAPGRQIQGRPPVYTHAVGMDTVNFIIASRYVLRRAFESIPRPAFQQSVDAAARAIATAEEARITARSTGTMGGAPLFVYELSSPDGTQRSTLAFAFRGLGEYFLRCQWDAAGQKAVPKACDTARSTFKIG
jgi:hypothetical protein